MKMTELYLFTIKRLYIYIMKLRSSFGGKPLDTKGAQQKTVFLFFYIF
jgi:hypothetical protein